MDDKQFEQLLISLKPNDKPLRTRVAEGTILTLIPSVFTALLLLIWHLYVDLSITAKTTQQDLRATAEVIKEDVSALKAKADFSSGGQAKLWEQITYIKLELNRLDKEHNGFNVPLFPKSTPPPSPEPTITPTEILKKIEEEKRGHEWRIEQEKKR
jgi:hypothetical protein